MYYFSCGEKQRRVNIAIADTDTISIFVTPNIGDIDISSTSVTATLFSLPTYFIIARKVVVTYAHNIISNSQHGFMSGKSCLTNLLESLECWTKVLDDGYGLDIIYLDYRKAFYSVPQKKTD